MEKLQFYFGNVLEIPLLIYEKLSRRRSYKATEFFCCSQQHFKWLTIIITRLLWSSQVPSNLLYFRPRTQLAEVGILLPSATCPVEESDPRDQHGQFVELQLLVLLWQRHEDSQLTGREDALQGGCNEGMRQRDQSREGQVHVTALWVHWADLWPPARRRRQWASPCWTVAGCRRRASAAESPAPPESWLGCRWSPCSLCSAWTPPPAGCSPDTRLKPQKK